MKKKSIIAILVGVVVIFAGLMIVSSIEKAQASPQIGKTYTTDADFDEGVLVGVEHETVHDQLQLSKELVTLPFIWVPNSYGMAGVPGAGNSISKIDTETGNELGRYLVGPGYSNPSRTTVDLKGSCWVGNRYTGTAVKVGLLEAGECIDRNGNGTIETSQDTNGNGIIDSGEMLPWGQDECVLYEVVLIPGYEGTFVPGTYTGQYTFNDWYVSPRGLAVDAKNNVWIGTWSTHTFFYVNGETGAIIKSVNTGWPSYGAVIDKNGILWSSGQSTNRIIRLDPSTDSVSTLYMGHFVYGIGLDYLDHLFASGWTQRRLSRVDITTGTKDWTKYRPEMYTSRGVAVTPDNNVWVANTNPSTVTRYDNDGNLLKSIPVCYHPTGVAVDHANKVWVNCLNGYVNRINPETNTVELSKKIGSGHYSYSDMTGYLSRTITTKIGTWTVVYDSGVIDTPWGKISWTSDELEGTSVTVKARSSNDGSTWSAWETATNGVLLTATPDGRYIQIETTFQIISGDVSPILYDLTVKPANLPPVAVAGGPYSGNEGSAITFDGSGSYDPDGTIVSYEWDLDCDGLYDDATGINPSYTWGDDYSGCIGLKVTDNGGLTATDTTTLTVNNLAPSLTLDTTAVISSAGGDAFVGRKGVEQNHQTSTTDPGSDDLIFNWSFGVTHTYYNDGLGPDPYPSPAGIFPFTANDTASTIFSAPGLYTLSVEVADDDGGTDSAELPKIVTDDYICTRSQGFWKHQFGRGKHQIDDETLQAYLDIVNFASAVFSEQVPASTLEEAGQVMWQKDDDEDDDENGDKSEMRKKAQAQLLAAWLNFASGAVQWTELIEIDDDDGISLPFYQLMAEAEEILLNPDATHQELEYAKDLTEAVNELDEDNPVCEDLEKEEPEEPEEAEEPVKPEQANNNSGKGKK